VERLGAFLLVFFPFVFPRGRPGSPPRPIFPVEGTLKGLVTNGPMSCFPSYHIPPPIGRGLLRLFFVHRKLQVVSIPFSSQSSPSFLDIGAPIFLLRYAWSTLALRVFPPCKLDPVPLGLRTQRLCYVSLLMVSRFGVFDFPSSFWQGISHFFRMIK